MTCWRVVYARHSQDATSAWPAWLIRIFDGEWSGLGIRDLLNMRGKGRPLVGDDAVTPNVSLLLQKRVEEGGLYQNGSDAARVDAGSGKGR